MGSPITIGALSTTAPPGETRSANGQLAPADRAGLDDRALIDAVRAGNLHAYGTLYERHVGAVRGLARRLCGNRVDADDVVADVFTNTLRAIKSGRGPRDDLRPYVLTSTRHTVIKLRTRRDSGRAIPTADELLDTPVTDEVQSADGADAISAAFGQLPDRFRNVLWLSCVEDLPPAEVGRHTDLSAGAASSLTLRARRALARSYLVSRITQPIVSADCVTVRDLLPSVVRAEATGVTIDRVDRHLAACCECRAAFDDMQSLAGSLRTIPWFAGVLAWLRSAAVRLTPEAFGGLGGTAGLAPVLVTALAVLTFTSADAPPPPAPSPAHAVTTPTRIVPLPVTQQVVAPKPTPVASQPAPIDDVDAVASAEPRSTTALRERDVPTPDTPPAQIELPELIVDDAAAIVAPQVEAASDALGTTVGDPLDTVDGVGQQVAATTAAVADTAGQALDGVDQTVVDVLRQAGADRVADTIEPVLDDTTELVTTQIVEPVADLAAGTAVDTTSLVTTTTNDLLSLTARH